MIEPTKNGPNKLLTAKEKIVEFSQNVEEYCRQKGVPVSLPRQIDQYVNMERSELMERTPLQLYEIQFEIHSYCYHLQTCYNQQVAKVNRCRYEIDKIITPILPDFRHIYGREEQRNAAILNDNHAGEFRKIEVMADAAATRLINLVSKLENICKVLDKIAWRKQDGQK